MKICVVGMGLIGGSLALALKRAGYSVDGFNRSPEHLSYAIARGIIDGAAKNFLPYDVVFVALPPEACAEFICNASFKDGAIVSDICGVKRGIAEKVGAAPRNFRYVGCHPMAGKESSGIENSSADLFDGANMIITRSGATDRGAQETLAALAFDMGFKRVVYCGAEFHDKKIAYVSQLAHVVSNAYVRDGELLGCSCFAGGSFQDMTRIAGVDEKVWSSLFLENADNLAEKIDGLVAALLEIKTAITGGDKAALEEVLLKGKVRRLGGEKDDFSGVEVVTREKG